MPEAPEVENMVRAIKDVEGQCLQLFEQIGVHKLIKNTHEKHIKACIEGLSLFEANRIGKWIQLRFSNSDQPSYDVYIHNAMYGTIRLFNMRETPSDSHKHDRAMFVFSDTQCEDEVSYSLAYRDVRCWGQIHLVPSNEKPKFIEKLGPDALFITADMYKNNFLQYPQRSVSELLMRQDIVAGIGNIYRSEILHDARISPFRLAEDVEEEEWDVLVSSTTGVLECAILAGGSSVSDYIQPNGQKGLAQATHVVYGRNGDFCDTCRDARVRVELVAKRKVFYCPKCQR
jgi:formamidopyrimidine-DNA glycosylase